MEHEEVSPELSRKLQAHVKKVKEKLEEVVYFMIAEKPVEDDPFTGLHPELQEVILGRVVETMMSAAGCAIDDTRRIIQEVVEENQRHG